MWILTWEVKELLMEVVTKLTVAAEESGAETKLRQTLRMLVKSMLCIVWGGVHNSHISLVGGQEKLWRTSELMSGVLTCTWAMA